MFKPNKFTIYTQENSNRMEIMKAYSFLGRSTGILGHNSINIGSSEESNWEGFGGQLSELTVRERERFFYGLRMI